jgi:hypothetical protein
MSKPHYVSRLFYMIEALSEWVRLILGGLHICFFRNTTPPNSENSLVRMVVTIQTKKMKNKMFTIKRNASGPGWHILNEKGREVCWVFEQGYGHKVKDKERAQMFCDLLNNAQDGQVSGANPANPFVENKTCHTHG